MVMRAGILLALMVVACMTLPFGAGLLAVLFVLGVLFGATAVRA
jgi:hypothetical protein